VAAEPEPELQEVVAPLTSNAVFLVVTVNPDDTSAARVRDLGADLAGLVRAVGFRDLDGRLSCVIGFGSRFWDRISPGARPAQLHEFRELTGVHHAPATPGDVLFHIRATRMDLCFELATQVMLKLEGAVTPVEEVHGFRYFEERDLLGFVDGTENPTGRTLADAVVIGAEDPAFTGSSYVVVQKYLHDMTAWNALSTERQEAIIGRTKLGNIEIDKDVRPTSAHNSLTTIEQDGRELKISRDNMPFGNAAAGEFGTYFIGYSRSPAIIEQMLTNMFVGRPPGNYDRLLDYSRAVTGGLFFVPSVTLLESLATA
jgi:putative iron-dependent peroxidase